MSESRDGENGGSLGAKGSLNESSSPSPAPHFHGHRDRLRNRFKESGAGGLADYELLELVLFRALPRRDTKPIAKSLLERFGNISGVLSAAPDRLKEISGVGETVIIELKLIKAVGEKLGRDALIDKPVLSSWTILIDYCTTTMAYEEREQFRILFLDKRNRLIADEVQQIGTVDHTPVYPREVMRRALELSATALIIVHNHPSGDPTPSRSDIDMTNKLVAVAEPLGIVIHDHIIVGRSGHSSFRALGLI